MAIGRRLMERWRRHPLAWGLGVGTVLLLLIVVPYLLHLPKPWPTNAFQMQFADLIAIYALFATVLIAVFSVIPNLDSIARSSRFAHYSELDQMYFEILKLALAEPFLRNPGKDWRKLAEAKREKYEIYAFVVWNFIETIRDRCEGDDELKGTWAPVMLAEGKVHKAWFEHHIRPAGTTERLFCGPFCQFYKDHMAGKSIDHLLGASWTYRDEVQAPAE
jgi:hypothetical protein